MLRQDVAEATFTVAALVTIIVILLIWLYAANRAYYLDLPYVCTDLYGEPVWSGTCSNDKVTLLTYEDGVLFFCGTTRIEAFSCVLVEKEDH